MFYSTTLNGRRRTQKRVVNYDQKKETGDDHISPYCSFVQVDKFTRLQKALTSVDLQND